MRCGSGFVGELAVWTDALEGIDLVPTTRQDTDWENRMASLFKVCPVRLGDVQ